jgi:GTP-binding protein
VLLHLVDGTSEDPGEAYRIVRGELDAYGHGLADKPEIVALTKADALTAEVIASQTAKLKTAVKTTPLVISSLSRAGVPEVLRALITVIDDAHDDDPNVAQSEAAAWQP